MDLLLEREAEQPIQPPLDKSVQYLTQIVQNPQDPNAQTAFSQTSQALAQVSSKVAASFTEAQAKSITEIGAAPYFLEDIGALISRLAAENQLTPAVMRDRLTELRDARNDYLDRLSKLQKILDSFGIIAPRPEPGEAQIGLVIPRALFSNELGDLGKELRTLSTIIRIVCQAYAHETPIVNISRISTSDPDFLLNMSREAVSALGQAVDWVLTTLLVVLQIRKVRSDLKKIPAYTDDEIAKLCDDKIKETVAAAVEKKVEELMGPQEKAAGAHHQERGELKWALESIFARVEKGMTIEVRFLPPPISDDTPQKEKETAQTLTQLSATLRFPPAEQSPVLELPPAQPPE